LHISADQISNDVFTGVFAGTEQVDDKYSGGFPLRQEAEYGVAQFFDGKLDVGFG
jgi:hypothetical protein